MKYFLITIHLKSGAVIQKKSENTWLLENGRVAWLDHLLRPIAPFITLAENQFSSESLTVRTEDIVVFLQRGVDEVR